MIAKGTVLLKYFLFLLVCVAGSSGVDCSGGFLYRPHDQYVPEGAINATFWCFFEQSLSVAWLINGTSIIEIFGSPTPPMNISKSTHMLGNVAVSVLTIGALLEYSGTEVTCQANILTPILEVCNASAVLLIRAPPGRVDNLELHFSLTELMLTWEHSSTTTDYTIQYCIDVYQTVGELRMLVRSVCIVNQTSYVFSTIESEPDPNDLFQFIITPRYNIAGARDGTSRNISGYFVADPPALPQDSMSVGVTIARDLLVTLLITLHNAESWITGGRKVDKFLVKVVVDSGQSYDCSPVCRLVTSNSTLSLHANCSDLPVQRHGNITVTAVNSIGSSNLTAPMSTHFIQNIRTQPCNSSQCQFEIMYDVVADSELVTGSFIVLNNGDENHYFVNRHSDNGARDGVSVSGLTKSRYNLLVFLLNGSGLPFTFPVNQQNKVVDVPVTADTDGNHDEREIHLKGFKHTGGGCFQCWFASSSSVSHCAVIIHTLDKVINFSLFERRGDSAHGCTTVEAGPYYGVAFGYTNNAIHGRPYKAGKIVVEEEKGTQTGVIISVVVLVAAGVALAIITLSAYVGQYYLKNNTRRDENAEHVGYDQRITYDNLRSQNNPITLQGLDLEMVEKLQGISSMEELMICCTDFNGDWSAICSTLIEMGKNQLAEKVHIQFILPKTIQMQGQSDSGRYTLTTSTIDDSGEDDHVQPGSDERVVFEDAQSECGGNGPSSQATPMCTKDAYAAEISERSVHEQETDTDVTTRFNDMIHVTLFSKGEGSPFYNKYNEDDAAPVDIGKDRAIIPFQSQLSKDLL